MNLSELIAAVEDRSGFNDSTFQTRWTSFLNEALREFARKQPWAGLEDELTTVVTSRFLTLPHFVDSIVAILNTTDNLPIDRGGHFTHQYSAVFSQGTTGRPILYDMLGDVPALAEPSGFIWFASTHASDVEPLYVTGLAANSGASGTALASTFRTLQVNATGTSPVTLSTLFTRLLSVSKSTDTNGDYFLYDAGNANAHISFIASDEHDARFRRLQLLYVPNSNRNLRIRFRHRPQPLRDSYQSPPPAVKPDFLIHHALALYWREKEQYQKAELERQAALMILEDEANKENNHDEPFSQIQPMVPEWLDRESDYYRGGY